MSLRVAFISFEDMKASLKPGNRVLIDSNRVTILNTTGDIVAEYTTGPQGQLWEEFSGIMSLPPKGYFRVTNLCVDPSTGKMVVKYDDTPA